MKALIEIDCDDGCTKCLDYVVTCGDPVASCAIFGETIKAAQRCDPCLESTARAQELLDAEAELKRMKDAETYEDERMP